MQETTTCIQQSTNLLKHLWGVDMSLESDAVLDVQPYLEYYRKECCHALHDAGRHIICRKHSDIIEIAKEILDGGSKESLKNRLCSNSTEPKPQNLDARIDASIDLTARLVSMIDIGPLQFGVSAGNKFMWKVVRSRTLSIGISHSLQIEKRMSGWRGTSKAVICTGMQG